MVSTAGRVEVWSLRATPNAVNWLEGNEYRFGYA